jgi:hypothetical protein
MESEKPQISKFRLRLGTVMTAGSFVFWGIIPLYCLLNIPLWLKGAGVTVLLVVSEVIFWLGLVILGNEAAKKYNLANRIKSFFTKKPRA